MDYLIAPSLASYLQRLKVPRVKAEIIKAVTNRDVKTFEETCIKVKIPSKFIRKMTGIIFSVEPDQEWPPRLWW